MTLFTEHHGVARVVYSAETNGSNVMGIELLRGVTSKAMFIEIGFDFFSFSDIDPTASPASFAIIRRDFFMITFFVELLKMEFRAALRAIGCLFST